jgi:hypothetical protein
MFGHSAITRPSPRMARTVWVCGLTASVLLWAVVAGVIGFAEGRPVAVAFHAKLLALFVLFAAGWTGGWLRTRHRWRPVPGVE